MRWVNLESIWSDIRFAVRQLWKSPGFAITTIVTLSLGIAATVAIFGFVDSALIRPLPYPSPSQLMGVFETRPMSGRHSGYSYPNYIDLERFNSVFSSIAAYEDKSFILTGPAGLQPVNGIGVTGSFFRILGVTPVLGRDFDAGPASQDLVASPATVILSYAAWQNRFGGKPDVLGKTVPLDGESYTIIGVLPRNFQFAPTGAAEFWTTLHPFAGDSCAQHRGCMVMGVVARLKDGVTLPQALAEVKAIAAREARLHPDPDRNRSATVIPLGAAILGDIQPILLTLLGGAGLLLLIAYVNVTGLLLSRSENRRREFAVRGALGAARNRLMRQFVIESLVVVAVSSALALFLATLTRRMILRLIPADMLDGMPYLRGTVWNWHVFLFAAALILIACILFALTPSLRLPFADLRAGLAEGGRGGIGTTWRHLGARLVVVELATTMVLLTGAGLLGKSFFMLMRVDIGFVPDHLATLHVIATDPDYQKDEQAVAFQKVVMKRLRNLPGVTAVGTANDLPVGGNSLTQIGFEARPALGENNEATHRTMSAEYLSALRAQLLSGRYFDENDNLKSPVVAIINQSLARRYFPDENPLGQLVFWHGRPQNPIRIVGVIADVKEIALDQQAAPVIYTPFDQGPSPDFAIVVRTSQEAASVLPSLVASIHKINPGIVTSDAGTMPELIQESSAAYLHRASAWLASSFAALALVLSIVGLYGVIAYSVTQRTREIGVRMALGAGRGSVYQLILKEAGWLTLTGLVIGLSCSLAAGVFMRSLLFGIRSWDVSILAAVAVVLIISALLASYIPARRAASVNPVEALRAE